MNYSVGVTKIDPKEKFKLKKPDIVDGLFIGYNNWNYFMRNNGSYMYDSNDLDSNVNVAGGEFPRGSGRTIVFAGGFYIGTIKVTGTGQDTQVVSKVEFSSEFRPGYITNSNVPFRSLTRDDHLAVSNRVYIIHKDDGHGNQGDWANWPGDHQLSGDPALVAEAQTWAVFNDVDTTLASANDPLPGIGVQVTMESFAFNDAYIRDAVILKFKIENKTDADYTRSYFGLWSDPDVNESSNDIIGTDSLRGLGFVYDSENETHPAAVGYDLFQGPVADVSELTPDLISKFSANNKTLVYDAIKNRYVKSSLPVGKMWLGLVSVNTYYGGTDPNSDKERYYLMQGKNKNTGEPKIGVGINYKYVFPGDPITQQGTPHVASAANRADHRILIASGPFTMKKNAKQEIWCAVVGGEGADRLAAFSKMRTRDDYVQTFFDRNFLRPGVPLAPRAVITPLSGKVAITWNDSAEYAEDTYGEDAEITIANGFTANYIKKDFQGYRVYKSRTGLPGSFQLLAQYDKIDAFGWVNDFFINDNGFLQTREYDLGSNTGLQYSFTDTNVTNGQKYFYAVTSYDAQPYIGDNNVLVSFIGGGTMPNPAGIPITQESPMEPNIVSIVPGAQSLPSNTIATLDSNRAEHIAGNSDGYVTVEIMDPTKVQSGTYTMEFFTIPSDSQGFPITGMAGGTLAYRFLRNGNVVPISSRTDDPNTFYDFNSNGIFEPEFDIKLNESTFATLQIDPKDASPHPTLIVDGMSVKVYSPSLGFKSFEVTANAGGPINPHAPGAAAEFLLSPENAFPFAGDPYDLPQQQQNGSYWLINNRRTLGSTTISGIFSEYVYNCVTTWNEGQWQLLVPNDFEIRFTATGQIGQINQTTTQINLPFEVWNVTQNRKLLVTVIDDDSSGTFNLTHYDHPVSSNTNDPMTDRFYIYDPYNTSPGTVGYDEWVIANYNLTSLTYNRILGRQVLVSWNGGSVTDPNWPNNIPVNKRMPEQGTVFKIITNKPNQVGDKFQFKTTAITPITEKKQLKKTLNDIRVVPNPLYLRSTYQADGKLIKFMFLPPTCKITIFTVAGDIVRTLTHNGTSDNDRYNAHPTDSTYVADALKTSMEHWDLKNGKGRFVASGMYIALIESPYGKKFVKFAVIQ